VLPVIYIQRCHAVPDLSAWEDIQSRAFKAGEIEPPTDKPILSLQNWRLFFLRYIFPNIFQNAVDNELLRHAKIIYSQKHQ
jgi:hypothetical protein